MLRVWLFRAYCAGVLAFLLVPIAAIVPLSFSSGSFLTYPLPGLSLRWYAEVLGGGKWLAALGNSLFVGSCATALALLLGTLAALGLARRRGPAVTALKLLMLSPMIVPVILVAVGSYFFLAPLALTSSYSGLILAHTVIAVPFVVVPVLTALELLDPNLARAAAACGATPAATPGAASGRNTRTKAVAGGAPRLVAACMYCGGMPRSTVYSGRIMNGSSTCVIATSTPVRL